MNYIIILVAWQAPSKQQIFKNLGFWGYSQILKIIFFYHFTSALIEWLYFDGLISSCFWIYSRGISFQEVVHVVGGSSDLVRVALQINFVSRCLNRTSQLLDTSHNQLLLEWLLLLRNQIIFGQPPPNLIFQVEMRVRLITLFEQLSPSFQAHSIAMAHNETHGHLNFFLFLDFKI